MSSQPSNKGLKIKTITILDDEKPEEIKNQTPKPPPNDQNLKLGDQSPLNDKNLTPSNST